MNLIVATLLLIQPGILESVLICDSCVASENLDIYLMHGLSFQWNWMKFGMWRGLLILSAVSVIHLVKMGLMQSESVIPPTTVEYGLMGSRLKR